MRLRKRAIRPVAKFTYWVNRLKAQNIKLINMLVYPQSGQLRILG